MLNEKQLDAVTHIYEQGETYLVGPMGCGKTLTALTAIDELIRDNHVIRALVVAPRRVCEQVWLQEINKWGLHRLNAAIATGTPDNRVRALTGSANVVCINFENLAWLFSKPDLFAGFDMLVVDEATKIKAGGKAFKSLRRHLKQFNTRLAMSGTPVSEDFGGLFYQAMIVDDGKAYGKNKQNWLERYFTPTDYMRYNWEVVMPVDLLAPFQHCMVTLPSYSDELPALVERTILLGGCRTPEYDGLARDMIVDNVTAANAAVLTSKLQQAACGFLYDDDGATVQIHHKKSEWLTAQLAGNPKAGNPKAGNPKAGNPKAGNRTVIVYQYKEELARLKKLFPDCFEIKDIAAFKRSKSGLLVMHPRSAGHGISLVEASTMIFMGPVWSRDLTRQTIARCYRRGQTSTTTVYTLTGAGTIEESMIDREAGKAVHHTALLAALGG